MTRVLVTGFGPFPGMRVNPSAELARRLARSQRLVRHGVDVTAEILDTRYAVLKGRLPTLLAGARPDIVLMLGVAGRSPDLRVEARGVHLRNMTTPDAGGAAASELTAGLPFVIRTRAPLASCVVALATARLPVRRSIDAGRYLCNAGYYEALSLARDEALVLFVHVPKPAPAAGTMPGARRHPRRPTLAAMESGLVELLLRVARSWRADRSGRPKSAHEARHAA